MPMSLTPGSKFLHAIEIKPGIAFESQNPTEELILILRAHPVTQIPWLINAFLFLVGIIIGFFFLTNFLNPVQLTFFVLGGVVFVGSYLWLNFLIYYFNVGLVSNQRILDIDFYSILYREVTEARLTRVEEITAKTSGYFGSLFNYGNVHVQTAGSTENIEFDNIPAPVDVVRIINELQGNSPEP